MNYLFIDIFTASSFVIKILFEYSNLHIIMNMIYFPVNHVHINIFIQIITHQHLNYFHGKTCMVVYEYVNK